jgi:hypothetical protein
MTDEDSVGISNCVRCAWVATPAAVLVIDFSVELVVVTDIGGGDFTFVQAGFTDEASVMGSFIATDFDNDGQIVFFADGSFSEVTAFAATFSGNALVLASGMRGPVRSNRATARSRAASSSSPRSPNPAPSRCSAWACSVSA